MSEAVGVLFIQTQSAFGADSAIHAHLMRALDRSAFTVHAACTVGDGPEKPPALGALEKIPNLKLRPTRFAPSLREKTLEAMLRNGARAALVPRELLALRDYAKKERIRIVHSTDRPRDAAYAVTLAKLIGAKSVVHVHVKWSNEHGFLSKWGVRHADAVFGISEYVTDTVVATGKPRDRVHTVLNCVDPSRWDPTTDGSSIRREFSIPEGAPLLASVSRLFSWKGQRELVRALALVREKVPNAYLMITGADEWYVHGGSFTSELEQLASQLGVADRVVFTGPRSDIPAIMAACDLFTLPSFEEPFGVVFLEAMAMKRAVIAVDNGGTPEVVEHGRAGLLSPPWDVPALAANIVTLLENREERERMGEYGRARVLEHFNAERMAREAGAAYLRILGSDARTGSSAAW